MMKRRKISAKNFMQTIAANIDNDKLTDADLREFIRNTLPIVKGVDYTPPEKESKLAVPKPDGPVPFNRRKT
jgi:hypothetical protein